MSSDQRLPPAAATPTRIVGRYAVFGPIASGGMASVHIGRLLGPAGFSRTVAIKRLHEHFARDPGFVKMFVDEARLTTRVRHPNVVPTLDVVIEGDELMLVMEYVEGESLYRLIAKSRALDEATPIGLVTRVVVDVLRGLEAAHTATDEQGHLLHLVHRDVSPQNVIVGVDGLARLLDFGVAKARGRLQTTREGELKGKLAYMAPEQLEGRVSHQSDLFAASAVLWETLTGRRLFSAESEGATLHLLINEPIPLPSSLRADVTPELDAVVMRGLERDTSRRYASAAEMADALAACVALAATPDVAAWVRRLAAEQLDTRSSQVREIESTPSAILNVSRPDLSAPVAMGSSHITADSDAKLPANDGDVTKVEPSRSSSAEDPPAVPNTKPRSAAIAVALAVICGMAIALWWNVRGRSESPVVAGERLVAAASSAELETTNAPSSASAPASVEPPAASALPSESVTEPAPPTPPATRTREPRTPATKSTPTVTASSPPVRPGCEQPSYRDDAGITRYRLECL